MPVGKDKTEFDNRLLKPTYYFTQVISNSPKFLCIKLKLKRGSLYSKYIMPSYRRVLAPVFHLRVPTAASSSAIKKSQFTNYYSL